jgi:hypothetical protein
VPNYRAWLDGPEQGWTYVMLPIVCPSRLYDEDESHACKCVRDHLYTGPDIGNSGGGHRPINTPGTAKPRQAEQDQATSIAGGPAEALSRLTGEAVGMTP